MTRSTSSTIILLGIIRLLLLLGLYFVIKFDVYLDLDLVLVSFPFVGKINLREKTIQL